VKLREKRKRNCPKQIVKRVFGGNMTLRETAAVQEPVVVLCGTRRHDSHKPNLYKKLKCSSVNFQCKDPERSAKNLSSSKNTSKAFSRCSVHFTRNMEAHGSSDLLENFHHNI